MPPKDTRVPAAKDIVQFAKDHRVELKSGDYTLTLDPTLSVQTSNGSPSINMAARTQDLAVRSERFQIPPNLIRSVFPASGSKGDYWNCLPHIVLDRSTLPWERSGAFPGDDDTSPTWLALLVFNEDDQPKLSVNTRQVNELTFLNQSRRENQRFQEAFRAAQDAGEDLGTPKMQWESGDKPEQKVHTIQVHLRHLPSQDELIPLTHVRRRLAFISEHGTLADAEKELSPSVHPLVGNSEYTVGLPVEDPESGIVAAKANFYKDSQSNELYEILEYDNTHDDGTPKFVLYHVAHEAATIIANRLPKPGAQNSVHLVSVEQRYWENSEPFEGRNTKAERQDPMMELISLYQWTFYCEEEMYTFQGLLRGLNGGKNSGQPGTLRLPRLSEESEPFLQSGFVPLSHQLREGSRSVSWYHGPLVPSAQRLHEEEAAHVPGLDFLSAHSSKEAAIQALQAKIPDFENIPPAVKALPDDVEKAFAFKAKPNNQLFIILQYQSGSTPFRLFKAHHADFLEVLQADQLLTYDTSNGMLDVAYAAAWELGKALTLGNKRIAQRIYNWKKAKTHHAQASQHIQEKGFHVLGTQHLQNSPPADDSIWEWLDELAHFKHIPFQYIVPDARMLPPESMRLFSPDERWLACLQDGAFSIGRFLSSDAAIDNAHIHNREVDYSQPSKSGFLLRSKLVSAYPEMAIVGYRKGKDAEGNPLIPEARPPADHEVPGLLEVVRREQLAPDVLLVLFKGEVDIIDFFLPAEALHFGFNEDKVPQTNASSHPDKLVLRPRNPNTGEVLDAKGGKDLEIKLKTYYGTEGKRILNIDEMHKELRKKGYLVGEDEKTPKVHSGTIALQLILNNELIRFQRHQE